MSISFEAGAKLNLSQHAPHRTVGNPTSMSALSPEDNLSPQLPDSFVGRQSPVELLTSRSELDIRVVSPEGHNVDGSPIMPSPSLAARGRSSPISATWDGVQMDDMPFYAERSSPSPIPVLSPLGIGGEMRRLIDSGQHTSPSDSGDYSSLAGRKGGRGYGLRSGENISLFRTRRNI